MQGGRPLSFKSHPKLTSKQFRVIPKKGQPGKWRLIVDLSSPGGYSVNDGINADEFAMHYIKLDEIIRMVAKHGPGAMMAKFDVEAAYRNVAVHPEDRYLLGMKWRGQFFVDLALPFGLRSAPYIFNSIADMVEWIIINRYMWPILCTILMIFSQQAQHVRTSAPIICKLPWPFVGHLAFPFIRASVLAR